MINSISVKTRFGWISAFEKEDKIFKVKFGSGHIRLLCQKI